MSIIQDALKKAQEDRAKKSEREVPYHLSDVQKKSRTSVIIYTIAGLCVASIFAYLYTPYFHKPKQVAQQPVAVSQPVPVNHARIPVKAPAIAETQISKKEVSEKKSANTLTGITPQSAIPVKPDKTKETAVKGTKNTTIQKNVLDAQAPGKTRPVELADRQGIADEPSKYIGKRMDEGNIDTMYNEALQQQKSGRIKEAKTIYKQILAKQPNHIETMNNLGVIAVQEGNTEEAFFYFKRILEYRKDYSKAYNNMGMIAMKDGDSKLAEEYLMKAVSLSPGDPDPYLNLSALFRSQSRLPEAARLLEIPIQKKVKEPRLFLSYAIIQDNLGHYEDAARYYRQYLSSISAPASKKDIIERLQYIETKIMNK